MSDISQGEGWWQASDGKWYAPELHPGLAASGPGAAGGEPTAAVPATDAGAGAAQPGAFDPTAAVPVAGGDPTVPVAPVGAVDPTVPVAPVGTEPTVASPFPPAGPPPAGPPFTAFGTPPPPAGGTGGGKGKLIAAIVIVLALIGGGIAFALTRGDDNKTATSSSQSSSSTASSDSTRSSSSTKSSSGDTAALLAKAKKALLVPTDVDPSFVKATADTSSSPLPCTNIDPDDKTPPDGMVATELDKGSDVAIIEHIRVYKSSSDAKKAYSAAKAGFDCSGSSDGTLTISSKPSSAGIKGSDEDFAVDAEYTGTASSSTGNLRENKAQATTTTKPLASSDPFATSSSSSAAGPDAIIQYYVVRVGQTILTFTYASTPASDTSKLDGPKTITTKGVAKFLK